jgi:hypothetical protein
LIAGEFPGLFTCAELLDMDLRDFDLWIQEAHRRSLGRRAELYSAALLPNQKADTVRREMDKIRLGLYEMDNEDSIEAVEKMARERLEKQKAMKKNPQGGVK